MEGKKGLAGPHHSRMVLVPQKAVIQFDTGGGVVTEIKTKPPVPSHRVPPQRQRSTVSKEDHKHDDRNATVETADNAPSSTDANIERQSIETGALANSYEDEATFSDTVMEAFMQNSPSVSHLTSSSPLTAEAALIARRRVAEEINRIHQRAHITEQQRQQYMQTALAMDAPRLARTVMKDEREAREEVLGLADRTGRTSSSGGGAGGGAVEAGEEYDVSSSLSFLTGGEMLILQERATELAEAAASRIQPFTPNMGDGTGGCNEEVAESLDSLLQADGEDEAYHGVPWTGPMPSGAEPRSGSHATQTPPAADDDLDQTVRVVREVSAAEKRQNEEDARFSKTVEEVERVRKRYIQKASLPLLSSLSNVEQLSSATLDRLGLGLGSPSDETSAVTAARPSTGGDGGVSVESHSIHPSGSAAGGLSGLSGLGARIRQQASGGNLSSLDPGGPGASGGMDSSRRTRNSGALSIGTSDAELTVDGGGKPDFPMLSPSQGRAPGAYLAVPVRERQSSGGSSGSSGNNAGTGTGAGTGIGIGAEVYEPKRSAISPKPSSSRLQALGGGGSDGVGAGEAGPVGGSHQPKSLRAGSGGSNNSSLSSAMNPHSTLSGSGHWHTVTLAAGVRAPSVSPVASSFPGAADGSDYFIDPELEDVLVYADVQEGVADSIDMLIGSRYGSERDLAEGEGSPPALLGSSLDLLQRRLESAGAANSSYHNLRAHHHQHQHQHLQVNAPGAAGKVSHGAATALATLSRPSTESARPRSARSGGGRRAAGAGPAEGRALPPLDLHSRPQEGAVHPLRSSEESVLSLGSQLFAFKREGSHANSADKSDQHDGFGTFYLASGYPSSLILGGAIEPSPNQGGRPSSAAMQLLQHQLHVVGPGQLPVFRSTYDSPAEPPHPQQQDHQHHHQQQQQLHQPRLSRVSSVGTTASAGSSLNYTAYLNALSPNSCSALANSMASMGSAAGHGRNILATPASAPMPASENGPLVRHHSKGNVMLQPLDTEPTDPAARKSSRPNTANCNPTTASAQPNVPLLQPLDLSALHRGGEAGMLPAKPAASPKGLSGVSARRRTPRGQGVSPRQARLSSIALDPSLGSGSSINNLPSRGARSNSSTTRSTARGSGLASTSSRAARLRQDAQLLLASPLSDWLNMGTSIHASGAGLPLVAGGWPEEEHAEVSPARRGSRFTFDGAELARLQSLQTDGGGSTARGLGRKSSADPSLSAVVSLPALLPGLAQADPARVSDVYRSLNILSGHFAQLGAQSLGSSLERSRTTGAVPAESAMTRDCSIDRELDELLTGPAGAGDSGTTGAPDASGQGSIPAPTVAQSQEVGRVGVASAGRAGRAARQSPLTSQSCAESGPGHVVTDVHSEPSLSALAHAGAAIILGKAGPLPARAKLQRSVLLGPAASTSALSEVAGRPQPSTALDATALGALPVNSPSSVVASPHSSNAAVKDALPSPVKEQIEGVVAQAISRSGAHTRTSGSSSASTVDLQRHAAGLDRISAAASPLPLSSLSATQRQPSAQQLLQQRLGALAAALDAGDAVGKLMANMVLGGGGGGAGAASAAASGQPRKR